jgi:hypothetical protein
VSIKEGHGSGVSGGKPKFFKSTRLLSEGWITFDDWVSYSGSKTLSFPKSLHDVSNLFVKNGLTVSYDKKNGIKTYTYTSYKKLVRFNQHKEETNPPVVIVKKLALEVFFGADICPGIALTLIQHLRAADPTGTFMKLALRKDFAKLVGLLIANIWIMIEGKVPGTFRYYDHKISKHLAEKIENLEDYMSSSSFSAPPCRECGCTTWSPASRGSGSLDGWTCAICDHPHD